MNTLDLWRCDVTGNICGTDTVMVGHECQCQGCRAWREITRLRQLFDTFSSKPNEIEMVYSYLLQRFINASRINDDEMINKIWNTCRLFEELWPQDTQRWADRVDMNKDLKEKIFTLD